MRHVFNLKAQQLMMEAQDLNQGNVVTDDIQNLSAGGGGGGNNNNNNNGGGGGGRKNFNRNFGGNNQVSDEFITSSKTRFNHLKPTYDLLQKNSNILLKYLILKNTRTE